MELNQQLAVVRRERDELNSEANAWAEKRNQLHEQIKALQAEAKRLKEQRNEINLQVQLLKAAREKAKAQRKEKREEIAKTRERIKPLVQKKPRTRLNDLEKEIQNLDWQIQTTSLSVKEEKGLVDQVRVLETQRSIHKQLKELRDTLFELQTEEKALETQAKLNHEKLSELAGKSQKFHEQMMEVLSNVKSLRQNADEAHQKYMEFRQKETRTHEKYVEIQRQIKALKEAQDRKEKEYYAKRGQALREEATRKAQDKMTRGEKLTWEEYKLITEQEELTEP